RAVNDHPRNITDDQLRTLAEHGGLLGLMLHPLAIDHVQRTIERVIDHLEHAAATVGVERICLGGGFIARITPEPPPQPPPPLAPGRPHAPRSRARVVDPRSGWSRGLPGAPRRARRARLERRPHRGGLPPQPAQVSPHGAARLMVETTTELEQRTSYLELFFDL